MKKTLLTITFWLLVLSADAQCWKYVVTTKDQGGGSGTYAIASNGTLWAFGSNGAGQIGDGTTTSRSLPVQIGTDNDWVYISAGYRQTFAIKADGTLWSWGNNTFYTLGDGTNVSQSVPHQVGTDTNWKTVNTQGTVVVALKTDGTIWRWGSDGFWDGAPFGSSTILQIQTPTQLGTDTDWISIERGNTFTMALKSDGSRWGYGAFLSGVAGNGTAESGSANLIQLDAGPWQSFTIGSHALGIKTDGSLWSWGNNSGGQVGNGTISYSVNVPVLIDNSHTWKLISTGRNDISTSGVSFAIRDDNTLWSWGGNTPTGTIVTLGHGNTTPTSIPIQVGDNSDWTSVSAGGDHTAGIRGNNALWTWGYIGQGGLGNGVLSTNAEYVLSPFNVVCPTPLPVTLQHFSVIPVESSINLTWTTTSETNADKFEIQRSTDAKQWQIIGQTKAKGFKESHRDYTFTDFSPMSGTNYYRLKMIDLDQTFSYSRIQNAKIDAPSAVLYPNPVSDYLLINHPGSVQKIEIIDTKGLIIAEYSSNPVAGINVKSFSPGLYLLQITEENGNIQRQKIVVKK